MNATITLPRSWNSAEPWGAELCPYQLEPGGEERANLRTGADPLQQRYRRALQALAKAERRAQQAERRLRSRLMERTWPATLGGIAGGFAAVVALRLAGM